MPKAIGSLPLYIPFSFYLHSIVPSECIGTAEKLPELQNCSQVKKKKKCGVSSPTIFVYDCRLPSSVRRLLQLLLDSYSSEFHRHMCPHGEQAAKLSDIVKARGNFVG